MVQYKHVIRSQFDFMVIRSANYTPPGHYIKCFHNSEHVLALHNHLPKGCIGRACSSIKMINERGHLQHYRQNCVCTQNRFLKWFHFIGKTVPIQSGRRAKKDMEPSLRETQQFGNGGSGWWETWPRFLINWASYSCENIWSLHHTLVRPFLSSLQRWKSCHQQEI